MSPASDTDYDIVHGGHPGSRVRGCDVPIASDVLERYVTPNLLSS